MGERVRPSPVLEVGGWGVYFYGEPISRGGGVYAHWNIVALISCVGFGRPSHHADGAMA